MGSPNLNIDHINVVQPIGVPMAAGQGGGEMSELAVVIGAWYQEPGGQSFEVVAFDVDTATIEIQFFEGEVEELEFETWGEMQIKSVAAPEDWTGAFEEIETDDLGYSDAAIQPENWAGALNVLDTAESL